MANAGDLLSSGLGAHRFLLLGGGGSGKTTLIRSLPGRTFVYAFDPNSLRSLAGATNIEYEGFFPGLLDMGVKPLSGKIQGDRGRPEEPKTYINWEKDFEHRLEIDYFSQFDSICLDSATTFADIIMDRVQFLAGKLGKQPDQADWAAQMATFMAVFRTLTGLGKRIICTGHVELRQDEEDGPFYFQPVFTGRLRIRVPLLFTDTLGTQVDHRRGKTTYSVQTVGDRRRQYIRCSLFGVEPEVDVTLDSLDPDVAQTQGLAAMYNLS